MKAMSVALLILVAILCAAAASADENKFDLAKGEGDYTFTGGNTLRVYNVDVHNWDGPDPTVEGHVRNTSSVNAGGLSVSVSFYEKDESKVGTSPDFIDSLGPGETWRFQVHIPGGGHSYKLTSVSATFDPGVPPSEGAPTAVDLNGREGWLGGRIEVKGPSVAGQSANVDTPLMSAVRRGDSKRVKAVIASGADVNASRGDGATAIMVAAVIGKVDLIKALIAAGADVNASTPGGVTPLMMASLEAKPDCVKALLVGGADVNAKDGSGETPLTLLPSGHPDIVAMLTAAVAAEATTPAVAPTSALEGVTDDEKLLVELIGTQIHARNFDGALTSLDSLRADIVSAKASAAGNAAPVLQGAASAPSPELPTSAALNAGDKDGDTPLMLATLSRDTDRVKALIAEHADVSLKDHDGWTALMWAAAAGNADVVKALLAAGADVATKNNRGETALAIADARGQADAAAALKAAGASE